MQKLEIKKSFYYSAGDKFNWSKDGYDRRGVGVERNLINNNEKLELVIDKVSYILDCLEAKKFINQYRSFYPAGYGKYIGVVSKTLLKEFSPVLSSNI